MYSSKSTEYIMPRVHEYRVHLHGAHSLKTLSVFHGMLGVGTDAIRAKQQNGQCQ